MQTIEVPRAIALAEDHAKRFAAIITQQRDLQTRQAAVRQFLGTVVQTGESRLAELAHGVSAVGTDLKKLWEEIAKVHGLDLSKHEFDLSEDGKTLVLKTVRLLP